MKATPILLLIAAVTALWLVTGKSQTAEAPARRPMMEYAFIRWDGFQNSHIIMPDNTVVFVGPELRKLAKPSGVDERHFYQNAMMNRLAGEGWRFLAHFRDDVIMQREK